jgi:uncharacterized membrane protein
MNYNDITLFAFGMGGVLVHNLMKIQELKKTNQFKAHTYFGMEWPSICISLILVLLAIAGKHEVAKLENAGVWLGGSFIAIGYMGQSLFIKLMGRANKFLNNVEK